MFKVHVSEATLPSVKGVGCLWHHATGLIAFLRKRLRSDLCERSSHYLPKAHQPKRSPYFLSGPLKTDVTLDLSTIPPFRGRIDSRPAFPKIPPRAELCTFRSNKTTSVYVLRALRSRNETTIIRKCDFIGTFLNAFIISSLLGTLKRIFFSINIGLLREFIPDRWCFITKINNAVKRGKY
jgi:hypothetical protein